MGRRPLPRRSRPSRRAEQPGRRPSAVVEWPRLNPGGETVRLRIAIVFLLLFTACGGGSDEPSTSGAGQPVTASSVPDDQQTLTVATPGDVYITRERNLLGMWPDNANICEPLLGIDTE